LSATAADEDVVAELVRRLDLIKAS